MRSPPLFGVLLGTLGLGGVLGACGAGQGCHPAQPVDAAAPLALDEAPTLRLFFLTDPAGALEPCGCVKDQLGGIDHLAAILEKARTGARATALFVAGPTFFMDTAASPDRKAQDDAKAETMAAALKQLGIVAFAPGKNDFASGGLPGLLRLAKDAGAAPLGANLGLSGSPGGVPEMPGSLVTTLGGVKVAVIGVSALDRGEAGVGGIDVRDPIAAVKSEVEKVKGAGAQVLIALAATGRGEAKRIADAVPELTAVVVGSPASTGDENSENPPGDRIGNVVVAETGNHLQGVAVLDLVVRAGSFAFVDASGLGDTKNRAELGRRIDELHKKIAIWEQDGKIEKKDLEARRADLAKLEAERGAMDTKPPPRDGSYSRYTLEEVRDSAGKDKAVSEVLLGYYKRVDEENKTAFASLLPRPAVSGAPHYIGVEACTDCHDEARKVWDKTAHAHAYATLADQFKEYNLDCVSCHVTGYGAPGGSTVAHVEKLQNVQCEVCHGPGSKHAAAPSKTAMPNAKPTAESCTTCHHPPHVHEFHGDEKLPLILGPGHGKPL